MNDLLWAGLGVLVITGAYGIGHIFVGRPHKAQRPPDGSPIGKHVAPRSKKS
jgi:hypothetical protein